MKYVSELEPYASTGDELLFTNTGVIFRVKGESFGSVILIHPGGDDEMRFDLERSIHFFKSGEIINLTRRNKERIKLWKSLK